jgi:hypothetical protein
MSRIDRFKEVYKVLRSDLIYFSIFSVNEINSSLDKMLLQLEVMDRSNILLETLDELLKVATLEEVDQLHEFFN